MAKLSISSILGPHWKALTVGLAAVMGESSAGLLQPWPLKVVFDNVLHSRGLTGHGWLNNRIVTVTGGDRLATLKLDALSALLIAVIAGLCSYLQKYLTTSVSQWVMHDLRRQVYSHIQRLSFAYHDHKQNRRFD